MIKNRYPIPAEPYRSQIKVERSRFISSVEPVSSPEDALAFVARIKQEFPDANHNCWAYLIGPPGSSDRIGLSDDGEPHGAAGKPMLTVLQHGSVGDIAVVVTRYFGGIKLGKGGMVKAYTRAVQTALEQLELVEKIDWAELALGFDYAQLSGIERLLPDFEAEIVARQFAEQIRLQLKLPAEQEEKLRAQLINLTAGKIVFQQPG
ncbi:MAG: YigZ family protein [Desulfuromonadales bacterium]|nr:YigZ family protein [Desulfuromonadales bacterium]